jgi:hypothetical protein
VGEERLPDRLGDRRQLLVTAVRLLDPARLGEVEDARREAHEQALGVTDRSGAPDQLLAHDEALLEMRHVQE